MQSARDEIEFYFRGLRFGGKRAFYGVSQICEMPENILIEASHFVFVFSE